MNPILWDYEDTFNPAGQVQRLLISERVALTVNMNKNGYLDGWEIDFQPKKAERRQAIARY